MDSEQLTQNKAYSISVMGRVQGVGFRYYTEKKALELGLTGYVQNQADGSVKIEAEGQEEQLLEFIHWCHKGPQWARVQKVSISELPPVGYAGFRIR
jgi:acylphosphatase